MAKDNPKKPTGKAPPPPPKVKVDKNTEKEFDRYKKFKDLESKSTKDLSKSISEVGNAYKDMADVLQKAVGSAKIFGDEWGDIEDISKSMIDNLGSIGDAMYKQVDFSKQEALIAAKRAKLGDERKKREEESTKYIDKELKASKKLKELQENYNDLINEAYTVGKKSSSEEEKALKSRLDAVAANLKELQLKKDISHAAETALQVEEDRLSNQNDIIAALKAQSDVLDKAHHKAEEMGVSISGMADEIMAPFEKAKSFLEEMPGGELISKAFGLDGIMDKVKTNVTQSFAKSLAETGSVGKASFSALSAGARTFMVSLGPILIPLLAIAAAAAAIKMALDMDQEVSDMAKGLGTSREEAEHVHHELLDIAANTKVVGANTKALGEAYMELAKSMGVSQIANKEMAETQVYLKNQIGMSADEASSFQKMSMAGGKSAEQNLAVIQAGVEGMTGGLMNYKEVAKDIGTSSKAVQASYKGNIAALTKAVVTAKKFGMTLDQTKKSADSILDVESSLEAEMKANVLTGKNMNLNAARELALKGDTAGAMEEMMNQAGGYDELMEMAPYQQKAVAEAMGMTVDEMIGAAEHQKNLNTMADELGITLDENGKMSEEDMQRAMESNNEEAKKLALQQQQASAQEKMSAMGDKLMTIFQKLAAPIMEMLEPLMNLVDFIFPAISAAISIAFFPLKIVFKTIGLIIDAWDYIFGVLGRLGSMINESLGDPIGKVVGFITGIGEGISNFFGGIFDKIKNGIKNLLPGWAIKLLGMDGGDAEKKAEREKKLTGKESTEKVHDAHIAPDGGLLVSGGKGTYQLDEKDSVIAGTNLEGTPGGGSTSAAAPASGNAEVVALLKELIKKVDQPVNINIGGRVVQELDRMITMNKTYNTKGDNTYGAT